MRGIGIAPVASEDDPDLDAATAGQVIDEVSTDIQAHGWFFNKEFNWKLTPDETTGYIQVPGSVLSIVTSGASRSAGLIIRDNKIYDLWNHTFDLRDRVVTISGSDVGYIEFTFITELAFNDLPPTAKMAISYVARRKFAQDLEIDERRWKFQKKDEIQAMNTFLREDAKNNKRNYLHELFCDSGS